MWDIYCINYSHQICSTLYKTRPNVWKWCQFKLSSYPDCRCFECQVNWKHYGPDKCSIMLKAFPSASFDEIRHWSFSFIELVLTTYVGAKVKQIFRRCSEVSIFQFAQFFFFFVFKHRQFLLNIQDFFLCVLFVSIPPLKRIRNEFIVAGCGLLWECGFS